MDEPTFDNIQELQQLADYQDRQNQIDELMPMPGDIDNVVEFADQDDKDSEQTLPNTLQSSTSTVPFSLPSRRSSVAFGTNTSTPVPHERANSSISKFILAMGLWCEDAGISRSHYTALRQILKMLEPHKEISLLPESVGTLKGWAKSQMPLLPLRQKTIPLRPEKLLSLRPSLKDSGLPPSESLYFFDPVELFSRFLSSPQILEKMHVDFAEFVDSPSQLWHAKAWASSI